MERVIRPTVTVKSYLPGGGRKLSILTANTTKPLPTRFSNSKNFATYLNNSTTTKKFHSNLVGNQFYDLRIT